MIWPAAAGALALALLTLVEVRRRYTRFCSWTEAHLKEAHPDLSIERRTAVDLLGRLAGVPVRLHLPTLFRRLRRRDGATLDRVIDEMRAALPVPAVLPFPAAHGALLPLIKPAGFADLFRRYPPAFHLVTQPFVEGLLVVYAALGYQQFTYVTAAMLEAWEITVDALHQLALANLRRRTEHLLLELGGPQRAYRHLDGFEASRILIPDLVTPTDIPDPLLAIPDEHVLLVAGADGTAALAQAVEGEWRASRSPLTPALFRAREASLRPEIVS